MFCELILDVDLHTFINILQLLYIYKFMGASNQTVECELNIDALDNETQSYLKVLIKLSPTTYVV